MCKSGYGCYHNTVWPTTFKLLATVLSGGGKWRAGWEEGGGQGGKVQGWCVGEGMKSD